MFKEAEMNLKKIFRKRKIEIGLLVGLCFFVLEIQVVGAGEVDDDQTRFRGRKKSNVEESIEIDDEENHADDDDSDDLPRASQNLIASHNSSSPQYDKNCTDCHGNVLSEQSLNPSRRTAHVSMLPQTPGEDNDIKCAWCHRSVDFIQKSNGNLRRHVNVTLCALCHGTYGVETQFYQAGLSPDNPDGSVLYELVCAACHRDLSNSEVMGESASEIQEEIDDNEGGMGPLNFLSRTEIRAIADALAQQGEDD
jgi:mono/diheme cytochrome c family protein